MRIHYALKFICTVVENWLSHRTTVKFCYGISFIYHYEIFIFLDVNKNHFKVKIRSFCQFEAAEMTILQSVIQTEYSACDSN